MFLVIVSALFLLSPAAAQVNDPIKDLEQISAENMAQSHIVKRNFLFSTEKNVILKYNPLTLTFGSLLFVYQNHISQQLSATCLYHPSCSAFGKDALEHYGLFKGTALAADRITRCNRISAHDIHPLTIDEQKHRGMDPVDLYK